MPAVTCVVDAQDDDTASYSSVPYSEDVDDPNGDGSNSDGESRNSCWRLLRSPNAWAAVCFSVWLVWGLLLYTLRPWGHERKPYTLIEALYIMAQIITTVGYGDQTPVCPGGMLFTCIYILVAVVVLTSLLTALTEAVVQKQQKVMEDAIKASFGIGSSKRVSDSRGPRFRTESAIENNVVLPRGWANLLLNFGIWSLCVVIGAMFMFLHPDEIKEEEGLGKMIKSFYFSIITLTTVGFGDITPSTQEGKLFCALWMLCGVAAFANFVSSFSAVFMASRESQRLEKNEGDKILTDMDIDHDGKVGQSEFLAYMLHKHGIGDTVGAGSLCDIIQIITKEFKDLDKDNSGTLEFSELKKFDDKFLVSHKSGIGTQLNLQ